MADAASDYPMTLTELEEGSIARRRLILRDSLAILSLTLLTVVLFVMTLFLFRSFAAHRADLAERWSGRGRVALAAAKPDEAVTELRAALTYAPGNRDYELLLAQALGETGRAEESEESYQYFISLWDVEPGNGTINLALARLARARNQRQSAVNFYRAAVYGTWEGDGVVRRAAVRLELARYLIAGGDLAAGRMELLIAGGNAPDDYARDMEIGGLLEQAQDAGDAAAYYQRAADARPGDADAAAADGRLAYKVGDYENARRLLEKAQAERAAKPPASTEGAKNGAATNGAASASEQAQTAQDAAMLENAARILDLVPLPTLPARERVARILTARGIAKQRFAACTAQLTSSGGVPPAMAALGAGWAGKDGTADDAALLGDSDEQASAMQLVYDTEVQTEKACGAASGDDALLLRLGSAQGGSTNQEPGGQAQTSVPRD